MRSLDLRALTILCSISVVLASSFQRELVRQRRDADEGEDDLIGDGWGAWSQPTKCSRSCGTGVQYKERQCLDEGENDSSTCVGPNRVYMLCNTEDCPADTPDYRAEQCSRYDNVEFNHTRYEWIPYYGGNECELNCYARGERFYHRHAAMVVDGTPCNQDSLDVCINGDCQHVGCDKVLGSDVKYDECHICGGDGSECKTIEGHVQTHHIKTGYHDLVLIPTGSTTIHLEEVEASKANILALRNLEGDYLLNGNFKIHPEGQVKIAGTTFHYRHRPQSLQSEGPTDQPLYAVLLRQHGESHKIKYEYSIPLTIKSGSKESYEWQGGDWSECSNECAGGVQTRDASCVRVSDGEVVEEELCRPFVDIDTEKECNTHLCPASWHHGPWEKCSATCGQGVQVRTVFCQQLTSTGFYKIVEATHCQAEEMPVSLQHCNEHDCPKWAEGEWSRCNRVCGPGYQTRTVSCKAQHPISNAASDILPAQRCDPEERPESRQECNRGPCNGVEWVVSAWSECRGSCESGYQTRQVVCSSKIGKVQPDGMCDPNRMPETRRPCSVDEEDCAPKPKWHASQWSVCSVRCGLGTQHRQVYCAKSEGESLVLIDDAECDRGVVMPTKRECNGTDCRGSWFSGPWGKCDKSCGGGEKGRDVMCFAAYMMIDTTECDPGNQPAATEMCNPDPCDEGDNGLVGDQIPVGLCIESYYGCCLDGITPARGPFHKGCPEFTCKETVYGCCKDGHTPAGGPDDEGCPKKHDCHHTAFGCCDDGITSANGFNKEGCHVVSHVKKCSNSVYGCCPDELTDAEGPNNEGCEDGSGELAPCETSRFGCCADGVTAARGAKGAGCNEILSDCESSRYGCCPDGYTAADGRNFQGCPGVVLFPGDSGCENTLYGCCADGIVAALGPDNEGCENIIFDDCANTVYGCCPDGKTIAEGPNYDSCTPACENTEFGCCPDGSTPALSLTLEGCSNVVVDVPCGQTFHGCCTDQVTPAKGPGLQGCPNITEDAFDCARTSYGCCLDGVTIAAGDNYEGCEEEGTFLYSCTYSPYGCCEDGETAASGPEHAGCPDKIQHGAACGLPEERGPCSNYSVKWYFNPVYGDCSRFWWGGCDGNENRFNTKEECQARCVTPAGELEKCYLPKAPGRCSASSEKFYYNPESHQCEKFVYGGCLGNANKFDTGEECQQECAIPHKSDVCDLPYQTGPCRGNFQRFFFDAANGMCRQFIYGGCKGNDNRFDSIESCEQRCMQPTEKVCHMPKVSGPCEALIQKWYFDVDTNRCSEFNYGGCEGNGNRFSTQEECERTCDEFLAPKEVDVCVQPQDQGPCKAYFERWYFDQEDGFCKQFVYGGCEGNGNRFETEEDCRNSCNANTPVDICVLPSETGPCRASMPRYFMDTVSGQCKEFIFGGCQGNANNFETSEECEKSCHSHVRPAVEGKGHCSLPTDGGPCLASMLRYYYDSAEGKCKKFLYGGCEGNRNRFISPEACLIECHDDDGDMNPTSAPKPSESPAGPIAELCGIPQDAGPCYEFEIWWYYDPQNSACRRFYFGGCGGNSNRFATEADCERRCGSDDVCSQSQEAGSCLGYIPAWSYNQDRDECVQFVYGGCEGNDNRFETSEACMSKCSVSSRETTGLAVCAMKHDSGPCRETETRWYYDGGEGRCMRFLYGGCEGNQNNYRTEEECKTACPSEDVCSLPSETGPCRAAKTRYHFNSASEKCEEFIYGGCAGNANRFMSKETCGRTCESQPEAPETPEPRISSSSPATAPSSAASTHHHTGDSSVCSMPKNPGPCADYEPVWYFEPNTRTCRRFLYGGCDGNGNRFESRIECKATCLDAKPAASTPSSTPASASATPGVTPSERPDQDEGTDDICMKKSDEGRYCTGWELYWYFDPSLATCRRFYWGGCDGNQNRFQSQEHCEGHCMSARKQNTEAGCFQPLERGPCSELVLRWYYDVSDGLCKQFYYGGCGGSANNFLTEAGCKNYCEVAEPSGDHEDEISSDTCLQPASKGPCKAYQSRWFYDPSDNTCKDFVYGGCEGNTNNFVAQKVCESVCKLNFIQGVDNICELPQDQGPCFALQLRWHFDKETQICTQFQYGGCQGNLNNFKSEKECQESCDAKEEQGVEKKDKDSCRLPKDSGPCFVDYLRYYYDETVGECRPFTYGGCQGNSNNFESQTECYATCADEDVKEFKMHTPGDCYPQADTGPCKAAHPRWYFDPSLGDCMAFYYGGCEGNGNNFRSHDDCISMCSRVSETCGVLQCNLDCPLGFARGPDGCQQCKCLNPCDNKRCPLGTECQIEQVNCVVEPCDPAEAVCVATPRTGKCPALDPSDPAVCITECDEDEDCTGSAKCCSSGCGKICVQPELPVPGSKPGFCPPLQPGLSTSCETLCSVDMDCPENGKCCSTGCGMICMPALYISSGSGCVNTVYGCCPDNKTPAGGWNLQGCTEEAPSIAEDPTDAVANVGDTVFIPCRAFGVPLPTVAWFRNREPILVSSNIDEEEGFALLQDGSLEITNAQVDDSTTYSCRAFNNIGAATRTYVLLVQVPVTFTDTATDVTVGVGERAKLECGASGNPVPAIRWLQNGLPIPMDDHYSEDGRGGLVISDATVLDEGQYTCEADNGVGYPVLRTITLNVATVFTINIEVVNSTYAVGDEMKIKCTIDGANELMIEWTKDGDKLDSEARIISTSQGELIIGDVQSKDAGVYSCSATRDEDTASAATKIDVLGVALPEDCVDKPWYADCKLIVEAQMCRHPYFSVFCCQSCHESGQLP